MTAVVRLMHVDPAEPAAVRVVVVTAAAGVDPVVALPTKWEV